MLSMKFIKRCLCLALCLLLCLPLLPGQVQAIDPMDVDRSCTLTLRFAPDGKAAEGTEFHVYRVASAGTVAEFTPVAPFDGYPVRINGLNSSGWADLATTLDGYVARDKIEASASACVGANGMASFSGLSTGLYLVTGAPYQWGDTLYTPKAVMISLPSRDQNDQWVYDVTAQVKYEEEDIPSRPDKISVNVQKVWVDNEDDAPFRPKSITVQLLKDGAVYDTVNLNLGNNWRHTWTELPPGHRWTIIEQTVVEGYEVYVSQDASFSFVVTNTSEDIEIPPTEPPLDEKPEVPDVNPPGTSGDKLPQTGMLWWPVPLLAVSGMGCFLAGWVKDRKDEDHEA